MQLYPNESSENVPEGDNQYGGDQFQDCDEGEAAEEMSASRKLPDPVQPSREERMEHDISGHAVFRSLCKHCLRGRCKEWPHSRGDHSEDREDIPILSWDYCYLCKVGNSAEEQAQAETEGSNPVE